MHAINTRTNDVFIISHTLRIRKSKGVFLMEKKRINTAKWMENQKRWQIKVQKDGERRTFTSSTPGRKGQREANAKADAWLDDGIMNGSTRVNVMFGSYIEHLKLNTSKSHWRQYEGYGRNWINPNIGRLKIEKVADKHIQDILDEMQKNGLSKKTQSNVKGCFVSFIKFCRKQKATTYVPEDIVISKKAYTKEKIILQPHDIVTLFMKDTTLLRGKEVYDIYINAYRFEVITGFRPGEVFGLKKTDIYAEIIKLSRSINEFNEITEGKNKNAKRIIAKNNLIKKILSDQETKMKELGIESKYVFPNANGDHIHQTSYYKRWVKYRDFHGLSGAYPYCLRHTFVSIVKSLPEGMLKQIIGHSQDMDSYGTYSHEVDGDLKLAANMIEDIFEKII